MEQLFDRKEEILQWMQPYMEERFRESCQIIQKKLELNGHEIWEELKTIIIEILAYANALQKKKQKERIKYISFSFLNYCTYFDRLEYRLDMMDDSFYLDMQETTGYYNPQFIQDRFLEDLEYFYQQMAKEFVRIQDYERMDIRWECVKFYDSIIFKMIESLRPLIIKMMIESGVLLADGFKIIYGEYMDRGTILYIEEKSRDEIFSDRNK